MGGLAVNFREGKAALAARTSILIAKAGQWREQAPLILARIKQTEPRLLAMNAAFGLAMVLGVGFIAYAALRPSPLPAPQAAPGAATAAAGNAEEALPIVEPLILMTTDADSARKINAAVAFSVAPNPAALPFKSLETGDDLQRSIDCLATGQYYEAGDDAEGQRAVAQVVLNRVRHPAFPNSVCGVVFQGSERTTGCQFSFTCDGSLTRRTPQAPAWARAQEIARQALTGSVFAAVGTATHYHTDWVVPYWSASLDKITAVKTHLFFRWTGWWGTPPAFRQAPATQAPVVPALAWLSDVHKTPEELASLRMTAALETMAIRREGNIFLIGWDAATTLDVLPQLAATLCGTNPECRVLGWPGGQKALPQAGNAAAIQRASFLYQPGIGVAAGRALWNCKNVKRAGAECLSPRDLASIKLEPAVELASLTPLLASLPPVEFQPADAASSAQAPSETAIIKVAATAPPVSEAIVMPTRKRRDPCAAMRGVAAADRIGPCAQGGF